MRRLSMLFVACVSSAACNAPEDRVSARRADVDGAPAAGEALVISGTLKIDEAALGGELPAAEATVFLKNFPDRAVKTTAAGTFALEVPEEVQAAALADGTLAVTWGAHYFVDGYHYGLRQDDVVLQRAVRETALGELTLPTAAAVTGVVKLAGQESHAGIVVELPGTIWKGETDAAGHYHIEGIAPEVSWQLRASKAGFTAKDGDAFTLARGEDRTLSEMTLDAAP